ncbi:MAG: NTP transferase domain-containing protein [Phycisphaerae bacterium]
MGAGRVAAILLAAGKGTRMRTELCKVMHTVLGRPMLAHVIDACRDAGVRDCFVVVGYGREAVMAAFAGDANLHWVHQEQQLGTGHAVLCCRDSVAGKYDDVLVLCGDGPLIRSETIRALLDRHHADAAAATLATAILDDPTGYGRIDRDAGGGLRGIIEHGDCTDAQRAIREVNPSYYCFRTTDLFAALADVKPDNQKGEYYLTDAIAILTRAGGKVGAITAVPPQDVFSINSRQDLALVNAVMRDRVNDRLMTGGVTIADPRSAWIDSRARIGPDTTIHPFVYIHGAATIGRGCVIGPFASVSGPVALPDGARLEPFSGARA